MRAGTHVRGSEHTGVFGWSAMFLPVYPAMADTGGSGCGPETSMRVPSPSRSRPHSPEVVDRLNKLRALSESDNQNEAGLAAERVKQLLGEKAGLETTDEIAMRLGAEMPAEPCDLCRDPYTHRSTGIQRSIWGTTDATASLLSQTGGVVNRSAENKGVGAVKVGFADRGLLLTPAACPNHASPRVSC
jgi:hypothetical protein